MEQNLCCILHLVSCMSLPTQLLALVHLLSRCCAPAAYPECGHQNTTAISCTIGAQALAVISGYLSYLSSFKLTLACCQSIKLHEILLTLHMRLAAIALIKLQHKEYAERRMTENNNYSIWKIAIEHTLTCSPQLTGAYFLHPSLIANYRDYHT